MKTINDIIQLLRSYEPYKTDEQLVEFLSELISDHYAKVNLNNDEIVFPWNPGECTSSAQKFEAVDVNLLFNTRHRGDNTISGLKKNIEDTLCAAINIPKSRLFPAKIKHKTTKDRVDDLIINRFIK